MWRVEDVCGGRVCEGVIEMFLMEFSSLESRVEVKE